MYVVTPLNRRNVYWLILIWLCFGVSVSKAEDIQNQTQFNATSSLTGSGNNGYKYQTLGPSSSTVTGVTVYLRSDIGSIDPSKYIQCSIGAVNEADGNVTAVGPLGVATSGVFTDSTTFFPIHFVFDSSVDFSVLAPTRVLVCGDVNGPGGTPGQGNVHIAVGGSNVSSSYQNGESRRGANGSGLPNSQDPPPRDFYMVWDRAQSVDITFPANGATVEDFLSWNVTYNLQSSGTIYIDYSRISSSSFEFSDSGIVPEAGASVIGIAKSQPLIFPPLVPPVQYYARARFVSSSTNATSGLISFYVSFPSTPFTLPTSSSPTATSTCDFTDSAFVNGFCGLFVFLFVPSTSSVSQFSNVWTAINTKAPIGYFTLIYDDFTSLSNGTGTYDLINASTTNALSALFVPIKALLSWLFWLLFGAWLFIRLRHFVP